MPDATEDISSINTNVKTNESESKEDTTTPNHLSPLSKSTPPNTKPPALHDSAVKQNSVPSHITTEITDERNEDTTSVDTIATTTINQDTTHPNTTADSNIASVTPSSLPIESSNTPISDDLPSQEDKITESKNGVSSSESDFELTPLSEFSTSISDVSASLSKAPSKVHLPNKELPTNPFVSTNIPQTLPESSIGLQEAQDLLVSLKVFIDNTKNFEVYQQKQAWLTQCFTTLQQTTWNRAQEDVSEVLYKWGRALLDFGQKEQGLQRFWELYKKFPGTRWYQQVVEDLIALEKPEGMIFIPEGAVILGESGQEYLVPPYFIDAYLVTNTKYYEFIKETGYPSPNYWIGDIYPVGKANHPVVGVNAEDAIAYSCWCQKRLPSEIEWEKAAKGPDNLLWPWGNQYEPNRCNCREMGLGDTTPIGHYPNGQSYYKGYDFSGNVWQWTDSWYNHKNYRVLRGGSWFTAEQFTTTTYRYFDFPNSRKGIYGFRCAKTFGRQSQTRE